VSGQLRAFVHTILNFRAPLSGVALYREVQSAYCWEMVTMMMIHSGGGDTSTTKMVTMVMIHSGGGDTSTTKMIS
jgi:hypothetical protein